MKCLQLSQTAHATKYVDGKERNIVAKQTPAKTKKNNAMFDVKYVVPIYGKRLMNFVISLHYNNVVLFTCLLLYSPVISTIYIKKIKALK